MCSLRDAAKDFGDLGVTVYGVSFDDVASQAAFAKAQKLKFALLSDPDASVGAKFGVKRRRGWYPRRVTFVIDDKGVLRHISEKVSVMTHGADLAALIEKLKS